MSLSSDTAKRLAEALTLVSAGNEMADLSNKSDALWNQSAKVMAASIVATNVSATIDFGALAVGDQLVHIPLTPGNAGYEVIVTAGTKPSAAVVGDLYIALRSKSAPTASNIIL